MRCSLNVSLGGRHVTVRWGRSTHFQEDSLTWLAGWRWLLANGLSSSPSAPLAEPRCSEHEVGTPYGSRAGVRGSGTAFSGEPWESPVTTYIIFYR